jgi:Family of unknown function (DUF5413)
MKRFLIFIVLGPAIGGILVFNSVSDQWSLNPFALLTSGMLSLPLALILGPVPALVLAALDYALGHRPLMDRMIVEGALAFVWIAGWVSYAEGHNAVIAGFGGLVPTLICVWLCEPRKDDAAA